MTGWACSTTFSTTWSTNCTEATIDAPTDAQGGTDNGGTADDGDTTGGGDATGSGGTISGGDATGGGDIRGFALDDRSAPGQVALAYVSDTPITVEWCADNVASDSAGAVVTFSGVVRDHDDGRGVTRLSYTAHPSAGEVIRRVADDVAAKHPGARLAIAHRTGDLGIGDIALACAVAAAHRGVAFAACADLVDEVKAQVPIWKEQYFTDGSTEWVGAIG